MTGHPDHQAVSAWVTEAWRASGCVADLWFATVTPDFHRRWGAVNERVGLWFEDSVPPVAPPWELVAQVCCTSELLHRKQRALRAHSSQTRQLEALVGPDVYRAWWATESFVAASRGHGGARLGRGEHSVVVNDAAHPVAGPVVCPGL